ncbi:MAG: MBL fold metallo-hydrolase [Cyanobacteria bacterium P01_F01_bin.42]
MNRRNFLRYAQLGTIASLGLGLKPQLAARAQAGSLNIQWLGHTCFLFSGSGRRVLVNPFERRGCTADYRSPLVSTDFVFISSQLSDEGAYQGLPGRPKLLSQAGTYDVEGFKVQGIKTLHDRKNGYQFGENIAWKWQQGGLTIAHLGGIASKIDIEQQILIGSPDVMLVPVGGSAKAYTPAEAKEAVDALEPKIVIPMHYKTQWSDTNNCDLLGVKSFLDLVNPTQVLQQGQSLTLSANSLPTSGPIIYVMNYA